MGLVFGCARVNESKVAVKERCGKFDGVLKPGTHCVPWCFGHNIAGVLSMRVQQLWIKCEAKTKDNVFVNVTTSVQFRPLPDNIDDAFYKLKNTTTQLQAYVFSVVRGMVPKLELDALYEQKNVIEKAVQEKLEKAMCAYGFEVLETLIVDIVLDETAKKAMNEATAAKFKQGV